MKIETLKERIEKKEAQIEKKLNTISKKRKQIEKKKSKVSALGYDPDGDRYQAVDTEDHNEVYWTMCDISSLREDIKRNEREIEEAKATLEKYRAQLAGEIEKEQQFIKEVPAQAKDMEQMLIEKWDESDMHRRQWYRDEAERLGYADFVKQYKYGAWEYRYATDEEIHNSNVKSARAFVLDLLNRTKEITGEIVSWSDVHLTVGTNGYPVLNGYVEGKEGRAVVESIYAGGYNIQRLHVRVLVKAC